MSLPPFPDLSTRSDDEAGKALLGWWIGYQLEARGVPILAGQRIPRQLGQRCAEATKRLESDDLHDIPLTTALRWAASGEFQRAGKLLKELVLSEGQQIVIERLAQLGSRVRTQRRRYSRLGNDEKRRAAEEKAARWREIGKPLRTKNPGKSNSWLAEQIATKSPGDKVSTIRAALPKLGLSKK